MAFTFSHTMVLSALHELHHGDTWPWPFGDQHGLEKTYSREDELLALAEVDKEGRLAFLFHPKASVSQALGALTEAISGARWSITGLDVISLGIQALGPLKQSQAYALYAAPPRQKALRSLPENLWEDEPIMGKTEYSFPSSYPLLFQKLYPEAQDFRQWSLPGNPAIFSVLAQDKLLLWTKKKASAKDSEKGFDSGAQHLLLHQIFQLYPNHSRLWLASGPGDTLAVELGFTLQEEGLLWTNSPD